MGSYIIVSEATKTARLPIRVSFDLKVRCKGDYYKWSWLVLLMWNERAGILQGLVPNVRQWLRANFGPRRFFIQGLIYLSQRTSKQQ